MVYPCSQCELEQKRFKGFAFTKTTSPIEFSVLNFCPSMNLKPAQDSFPDSALESALKKQVLEGFRTLWTQNTARVYVGAHLLSLSLVANLWRQADHKIKAHFRDIFLRTIQVQPKCSVILICVLLSGQFIDWGTKGMPHVSVKKAKMSYSLLLCI